MTISSYIIKDILFSCLLIGFSFCIAVVDEKLASHFKATEVQKLS